MSNYDVVVLGGGAAGLFSAIECGKRGRSVLVIESNDRLGRKVLISGGGRCNFTNIFAAPEHYISSNPHFCRSALARYTPADFIALVESHGIPYHEKKLGQLFCDRSANEILGMLEDEASAVQVEVVHTRVVAVEQDDGFQVETEAGTFTSSSLVVATGGVSVPKIGATDFGYRLARQFGHKVTPVRPGLVPFTFGGDDLRFCAALSGISIDVVASAGGQSFRENLLFTHRGLSGPAILQVSSYWQPGTAVKIDLLPDLTTEALLAGNETRDLTAVLGERLPRRFVHAWCERYFPSRPVNRYSIRELERLDILLHAWELTPAGTEGFGKAEVTVGGVDTDGLSSRTMESRLVPGLYFIGEVVDVTGWLGGYNFQWAWASAYAAGQDA